MIQIDQTFTMWFTSMVNVETVICFEAASSIMNFTLSSESNQCTKCRRKIIEIALVYSIMYTEQKALALLKSLFLPRNSTPLQYEAFQLKFVESNLDTFVGRFLALFVSFSR